MKNFFSNLSREYSVYFLPTAVVLVLILITMYVLDTEKHHLPRIHVRYNDFNASIGIPNGEVLEGKQREHTP